MLDNSSVSGFEERNSRKQPLDDQLAQQLLESVKAVFVARGKNLREIPSGEAQLSDLKGPTGNYRAPMVRVDDRLLVGFHPETLGRWLGE